jgi:RNase P subunit RPR2
MAKRRNRTRLLEEVGDVARSKIETIVVLNAKLAIDIKASTRSRYRRDCRSFPSHSAAGDL